MESQIAFKDCTKFVSDVYSVKTVDEISAIRVAAKFTEFVFQDGTQRIETLIDE